MKKINESGSFDGEHHHGFRPKHSTRTAVLELQRCIAEGLETKKEVITCSIDLLAMFDVLRRDMFVKNNKKLGR